MLSLAIILAFVAGLVTGTTWLWALAIVVTIVIGLLVAIYD